MDKPKIEPYLKKGGSAFQNNLLNATHPRSSIEDRDSVFVVSLSEWCEKNFITKRTGRKLIKLKLLVAFRRHHIWWVAANPDCINALLEYLNLEELFFDATQN